MALLNIKQKIASNFEQNSFTVGLFLDFRKAFDSIRHDVLYHKLPLCGIRGVALNLVTSYLSDRLQFTCLNGFRSSMRPIIYGVPQGSILGPLFFLLYINDIVHIPLTPNITLYADDTSAFFSGRCLREIESSVNTWLREFSSWLICNHLQLNVNKTKFVVFKSKNKPDNCSITL